MTGVQTCALPISDAFEGSSSRSDGIQEDVSDSCQLEAGVSEAACSKLILVGDGRLPLNGSPSQ